MTQKEEKTPGGANPVVYESGWKAFLIAALITGAIVLIVKFIF